jgi:hypothetical protein
MIVCQSTRSTHLVLVIVELDLVISKSALNCEDISMCTLRSMQSIEYGLINPFLISQVTQK